MGVTVNEGMQARVIQLWVDAYNAPYVITKPIHSTQRLLQQNEDGSIVINLFLKENFGIRTHNPRVWCQYGSLETRTIA